MQRVSSGTCRRLCAAYNRAIRPPHEPISARNSSPSRLARDVLRFGEFVTKAGRQTPYFFNAGLFNDGESLRRLGGFYAEA